jgi:hypothetical protein
MKLQDTIRLISAPRKSLAAFYSQDRTSATFSGCIEELPFPQHLADSHKEHTDTIKLFQAGWCPGEIVCALNPFGATGNFFKGLINLH